MKGKTVISSLRFRIVSCICIVCIFAGMIDTVSASAKSKVQTDIPNMIEQGDYTAKGNQTTKEFNKNQTTYYFEKEHNRIKATGSFFESSYLVVMTWNLVSGSSNQQYTKEWLTSSYKTSKKLTLEDKSIVEVFYTSGCNNEVNDKELDQALLKIFKSIKNYSYFEPFPLTKPLVRSVRKINKSDYKQAAKEFYDQKNYAPWYVLYQQLDDNVKKEYIERIIKEQNCTGFKYIAHDMSCEQVEQVFTQAYKSNKIKIIKILLDFVSDRTVDDYFKKAYQEKNLKYMKAAVGYLSDETITGYAKKSYEEKYIECFQLLNDRLECAELDKYIEKSYKEGNTASFKTLIDHLDDKQFDQYLEASFKNDQVEIFQELIGEADYDTKEYYYDKAKKEKKPKFIKIIKEYIC